MCCENNVSADLYKDYCVDTHYLIRGQLYEIPSKGEKDVGQILKDVMPDDLIKSGLIPEFVGRLPIVVTLEALNEDGETLLQDYESRGKDSLTVTGELLDRAVALGFLSPGGKVSFSIDAPDEARFEAYGAALQQREDAEKDANVKHISFLSFACDRGDRRCRWPGRRRG